MYFAAKSILVWGEGGSNANFLTGNASKIETFFPCSGKKCKKWFESIHLFGPVVLGTSRCDENLPTLLGCAEEGLELDEAPTLGGLQDGIPMY